MKTALKKKLSELSKKVESISSERKQTLQPLIDYITQRQVQNEATRLIFICTHNARRSHMAQVWAVLAAMHADLENIECYSGGTEETRIHPNALTALRESGIDIVGEDEGENPMFILNLGEAQMLELYSKTYDDEHNPQSGFVAVMVCSSAEKNCPFVVGAEKRISITYEDPKFFDDLPDPILGYIERSDQIATEMIYVMRQVSQKLEL
ncbi:MAG: protein-tyrosine-phosphatase [Salibacteraceae bacterium]